MTDLKCSVTNCYYNKEKLCCLDSIKVDGTTAEISDETACASFKDRPENNFSNSCGCSSAPNHSIKIDCMAEKCVHNTACCCTASAIDVDGANACTCRDTRCSTFRME